MSFQGNTVVKNVSLVACRMESPKIMVVSFSVLSRANFEDEQAYIYRINTLSHRSFCTSSSFSLPLSNHLLLYLYLKSQREK